MKPHDSEMPIDPVCGKTVNDTSPHGCVRSGAKFFFCSQACRASFMAAPLRFAVTNVLEYDTPAPTPEPPSIKLSEKLVGMATGKYRALDRAWKLEPQSQRGGLRGLIMSWLLAWNEGRHATHTSQELLALYNSISADHRGLNDRELFKLLVMSRNGCDEMAAKDILECAEESFAAWPVRRELTLCDVVHYLSVKEFLALHEGDHWMRRSDIQYVIASHIPHDLCIHRKS